MNMTLKSPPTRARARGLAAALLLAGAFLAADAAAAALSISCGAVGRELALCRSGAEAWARERGHEVRVVTAPNDTNERLALYQQLLASGSADVDLFQIDVVWPGTLASQLVDLTPYVGDEPKRHFPNLVANNRVDGRLVALPWFSSAGLLYYRKDLLERYGEPVPGTWADLVRIARRIQDAERAAGSAGIWGYVWQGRAYEGLTCNALEWIASEGGGTLIDADGQVTVDNPAAAGALERAASWVGTLSPPGVTGYGEEDARGVFQSGHAVFMRNWPYAWALAQAPDSPVRGQVGVAALPRGDGPGAVPAATLGGWQLAVSRHSRHPELAADLALYLTSEAEQRRRALEGSFNPTRPALYRDPEILAANPFMGFLGEALERAVPRPSAVAGSDYNRISSRVWSTTHRILAGREPAAPALRRLDRDLRRILARGRR